MGVVYKGEDLTLGRFVALKFLPPELTRDDDARKRFLREARAASQLDHPNICTVHEIGESDGQTWIAMGFCDGETLKARIERGVLEIGEVIGLGLQIARGLAKAHASGIVHRDIKPANVMVTKDGVAKIVDFGLAKLSGASHITHTSQARSGTSIDLNTVTAYRHGKFSAIPTPVSPTISVITIEAWLYWDGTDNIMPFGFTSYDIYFSGGNVGFNRGAGDPYGVSSTGLSNKWIHFVAVMYHNQNYNVANNIYINGALQTLTQKAGSSGTVSLSKDLHIGGWANDAGYRWTGRIDELAVYNYELTADQVLAHYRAVTDRQYASTRTYIRRAAETPGYWEWTGSGQAQAYLWSLQRFSTCFSG